MLTVVVSLLASGSLLFVVVPKGISEYTSGDRDDSAPTTSVAPFKSASSVADRTSFVARVSTADDASTAVCLGPRLFIVPLHMSNGQGPVIVSKGATGSVAVVVQRFEELGMALVRTASKVTGVRAITMKMILSPEAASDLPGHSIVDAWSTIEFAPEKSLMTRDANGDVAIGAATPVHGLGVVIDPAGRAVGVVVHRTHASWIVARSWIERIIAAWS